MKRPRVTWSSPRDPYLSEYRALGEQVRYLEWCREYTRAVEALPAARRNCDPEGGGSSPPDGSQER